MGKCRHPEKARGYWSRNASDYTGNYRVGWICGKCGMNKETGLATAKPNWEKKPIAVRPPR